jgi:ankyrin repeat protein
MAAAVRGHASTVDILLANNAIVDLQNNDGHSALMFAYNGKNQVQTLLQQYEAFVVENNALEENDQEKASMTAELAGSVALINTALQQHQETVRLLLKNGASETLKDKEGHIAVDFDFQVSSLEVVEPNKVEKKDDLDEHIEL